MKQTLNFSLMDKLREECKQYAKCDEDVHWFTI